MAVQGQFRVQDLLPTQLQHLSAVDMEVLVVLDQWRVQDLLRSQLQHLSAADMEVLVV